MTVVRLMQEISDRGEAVYAVSYAIGKVIARKTIEADPALQRLDALGRASAAHTMALNMTQDLAEEAEAALSALQTLAAHQRREAAR